MAAALSPLAVGWGGGTASLWRGSPAGVVLCAQHLGIPPVPVSLWKAVSGQGDRTWEDSILGEPFSCGHSPGDWGQKGSPDAGAAGAGESSEILGSLVQPCVAQTGGIIHFLH